MTLKISISGIRGIVGQSLTNDVIENFSTAFAHYLKNGSIAIGNDGRPSSSFIKDLVISKLTNMNCFVIDCGICPTPTLQLAVKDLHCDGGMVITASHNPIEWNGLKFVSKKGVFLNEKEANELIDIYKKITDKNISHTKDIKEKIISSLYKVDKKVLDRHIEKIVNKIPVKEIQKNQFLVVIDCCNGAGSIIVPKLLKTLGCEIISINTEPGKIPDRPLEPIPQNLEKLSKIVKEFNADIGFALDPDADRLSIVSDNGTPIGEEYSIALATYYLLKFKKFNEKNKTVVINLSTSRITEDIAKNFGANVVRTKVGEINVSEKIIESQAIVGGEGNGGVIWPEIGFGRDSITGIGLVLSLLAETKTKISKIIDELPKYYMIKDKIEVEKEMEFSKITKKIKSIFKNETPKINLLDGIKVDLPNSWIHIRISNTEPIIRIIAEGKSIEEIQKIVNIIKDSIKQNL